MLVMEHHVRKHPNDTLYLQSTHTPLLLIDNRCDITSEVLATTSSSMCMMMHRRRFFWYRNPA